MKVIIMGAGIAGLCMAHELRRRGITDIRIIDKAHQFEHVGAGIHIGTWGMTVLDANGTGEAVRSRGFPYLSRRYLDRDGSTVGVVSHEDLSRRHGGVTGVFMHRADLHEALLEGLPEGIVELGVHVTAIDNDADVVRVHTRESGVIEGDVLIGCDGLHSQVREEVFAGIAHPLGKRVIRMVVPAPVDIESIEESVRVSESRHSPGVVPMSG